MTNDELIERLANNDDEYLRFERVENKLNARPDVHAFLLLSQLIPDTEDMVAAAEHDEIFLCTNVERLAEVITPEQIVELQRCGVRYDSQSDSLAMFV